MKNATLLLGVPFGLAALIAGGIAGGRGAYWIGSTVMQFIGFSSPTVFRNLIGAVFVLAGVVIAILVIWRIYMNNQFRFGMSEDTRMGLLLRFTRYFAIRMFVFGVSLGIAYAGIVILVLSVS